MGFAPGDVIFLTPRQFSSVRNLWNFDAGQIAKSILSFLKPI